MSSKRLLTPAQTSQLVYIASLLGLAVATDILVVAWAGTNEYRVLSVPVALAFVGSSATLAGTRGALLATIGALAVLILGRYSNEQSLNGHDVLASALFSVAALAIAALAISRTRITSQLEARELEARQAAEREADLNRAKDDFVSLVAHEMRNPMTVIVGSVDLLARNPGTGEMQLELVRGLWNEAQRLKRLIEDLLELGRLDAGSHPMQEPVLLQRLVPGVVADFDGRYVNEITVKLGEDLPMVSCSKVQIERVLANLLDNAGKYSDRGSPIRVEAKDLPDSVEIHVLDSGPGISDATIDQAFELSSAGQTPEEGRGYGLGLAISKRLVEANRGHIWAINRPSGGLELAFSLPLFRDEKAIR